VPLTGQGEDDVKVVGGEHLLLPIIQPLTNALGTAARTGAMAARVVPDLRDVALGTAPDVAAQRGRSARHHGLGGFLDPARQLVRPRICRNAGLENGL
jgi:hypothetical protein